MNIRLRCRCGKLQGELDAKRVAARGVCYCKDCQAYARFLKAQGAVLDEAGGTEVAAAPPAALCFTAGIEHLACMSLSPKGIYRWYAACCDTPIGNTPRNPHMSYVGLVRTCLDATPDTLDRELGRGRFAANTESAYGPAETTPLRLAFAVLKIGGMLARARIGGGYRDNPFFQPGSDRPLREPRVLTRAERAALTPGMRV